MKQQETNHFLLMFRATRTNDFLNQQAMLTAMKSRAHFIISNWGVRWKFCLSEPIGARKNARTNTKQMDSEEDNKNTFFYYSTSN